MNKTTLILGLAVLVVVAGVALICFAPGGLLGDRFETFETPYGSFAVSRENRPNFGPFIGCLFIGLGCIGLGHGFEASTRTRGCAGENSEEW